MEKNCLITRLNASVNNPGLPILGGASVTILTSAGTSPRTGSLRCTQGTTAKLVNKLTGVEIPLSDSVNLDLTTLVGAEPQEYYFVSKYESMPVQGSTNYIYGLLFNIEDFASIPASKLNLYYTGSITGNLESLQSGEEVTDIYFNLSMSDGISKVTGDLGNILRKWPNIGKNSGKFTLLNTNVTGNIADLGLIKFKPNSLLIPMLAVGEFHDAIVQWRTTLGTSGTINPVMAGTGAHLWSVSVPSVSKVFQLSWTETTSSITIDGVTTTFDESGNIIE